MKINVMFLLLWPAMLFAQVEYVQYQGSNRLEYRYSENDKSEEFNNWLDVDYRLDNFTTGLRVEMLQSSLQTPSVENVSQRFFQFEQNDIKIRVGNFYKRLGKGIIFHSFETRNISLDRLQQSFVIDRNVDGVLLEISKNMYDITLLSGKPVWLRGETVRGGEAKLRPLSSTELGFSYLRVNDQNINGPLQTELKSGQMSLYFSRLDVSMEYARKQVPHGIRLKDGDAFYLSSNLYGSNYGLGFELKNYNHFYSAYNNPPTLVREHFVTLLNRHTHVLQAEDEIGQQLEAFYSPFANTTVTANHSWGSNHNNDDRTKYKEWYAELKHGFGQLFTGRFFYDQGYDNLAGEKDRKTGALELDYYISNSNSLLLDVQYQKIEKKSFVEWNVENFLAVLAFSKAHVGTVGLQYEKTDDKFSDRTEWISVNVNIKIGEQHDLFLTYGQRRAGMVCSGGNCHFVPEFEGFEFRLNSRF